MVEPLTLTVGKTPELVRGPVILRAAAGPIRVMAKKEAEAGREVIRKVVNISSMAGTNGNVGQVNYASAKSAMIGMTKTLAKEWRRYKVCVNCIAFGVIETRLTKANDDPETRIEIEGKIIQAGVPAQALNAFRTMIPRGRAGTTEEAAGGINCFARTKATISAERCCSSAT